MALAVLNSRKNQKQIFISHNKIDKEIARNIGLFLVIEGLNVWFDEWEISAGESIIDKINDGLIDCSHLILIWSKNASKSNWVRRELYYAITEANVSGKPKIIPIKVDSTTLPPLIADIKYINYSDGNEHLRQQLINAVKNVRPTYTLIKAIVKKYNEVIFNYESGDPLPYNACPECGSNLLKRSGAIDDIRDQKYYYIECKDCDWSDWSQ